MLQGQHQTEVTMCICIGDTELRKRRHVTAHCIVGARAVHADSHITGDAAARTRQFHIGVRTFHWNDNNTLWWWQQFIVAVTAVLYVWL